MKIFNTLSGQKEEFVPQDGEVKMYVCGVTPYSDSHLGHAMSYIYFDTIRRYLKFRGYRVKYVQNVTDIDDKIIDRAARLGVPAHELAGKYTSGFFEDMAALNILPADVYPKATEEIPRMLEIIQGLVGNGYAYPSQGSVYFRVRKVTDYGKLSHRTLDSMEAGIRIESGDEKEHPMDFVLWKAAKPGEPSWLSPWGPGRPGWHIECSAMSLKYLGETIDIHGGGQDLIFPHHENEIAQSESFTDKKPFVRYWMHNGLLQLGEEKMSKSLGNLITIREALKRYSADAIRIFVLGSYYRGPLTYSEEALEAAERGAERLRQAARDEPFDSAQDKPSEGATKTEVDTQTYRAKFIEAMDDDFNTAQALATLFDLARDINRVSNGGNRPVQAKEALAELAGILGLTLKEAEGVPVEAAPFIELLIATRRELRQAKQWQLADNIRSQLVELGIILEDTAKGTVWKRKR
ncbi:MAG: cysteine--tRNA ligase [Chloroflexi bacterium]|nr:cysteine--tRNA ligase [Chloroflexota bacterium]